MVRAVVVEEAIREFINDLIANKEFAVGLILGQITDEHYHVIHLTKTPLQSDEQNEEKCKGLKKPKKNHSLEDWDASLLSLHAKQVTRMLLGGLSVLGIFIFTHKDVLETTVLATLKLMLNGIHKVLYHPQYQMVPEQVDPLLMHLSLNPNKIECKVVDICSSLASPKVADFRFQSSVGKWKLIECRLAIDLFIPLPKETTEMNLINQFIKGLAPFCKDIWNATALLNGNLRNEEDLLGGKEVKGKRAQLTSSNSSYRVDLLLDSNCADAIKQVEMNEINCGASMRVKGAIEGRAYVTVKSTVNAAIQYLKQDLVRSLISRCEVHCEDMLVIDEEQRDRVVLHELPCRILVPLPHREISLADYIFPGETVDDVPFAFQELLGLAVEAKDMEMNCERLPDTLDLLEPSPETNSNISGKHANSHRPSSNPCNYMLIGLSLVVACIAGGTFYYSSLN